MKGKSFIALVVLFLCTCPVSAGIVHFRDGLTHDIDYFIGDDVYVDYQTPYMYTAINWLDGKSSGGILCGYNHSRINIPGGSIHTLYSYDSSQVNISSGSIGYRLYSNGSSQVNISGGSINSIFSRHSSRVDISGGSIWDRLCSWEVSQVDITGGDIDVLYSGDSSRVNISGGSIWDLRSFYTSQVNISGGSIWSNIHSNAHSHVDITGGIVVGFLRPSDTSQIQIFGYDFEVDGQPFGYGEITSICGVWPERDPIRHLTGTLLSGELIDSDFRIGYNAKIILTIPEPASAIMLGLGSLIFSLWRRR